MNQSSHSANAAIPAAPLFASSWAAFFSLIRAQFMQRDPVREAEPAKHSGDH
jgi:hypothetical protein